MHGGETIATGFRVGFWGRRICCAMYSDTFLSFRVGLDLTVLNLSPSVVNPISYQAPQEISNLARFFVLGV